MPRQRPYGVIRGHLTFSVPLPAGTGAVEFVTDWVGGFVYTIESVKAYAAVAGVGAGATRTLRVVKGASTVVASGAVTEASTSAVGEETALTVTAANARFGDADTLTLDVPATGTAFTAGSIEVVITYRQHPQAIAGNG